MQKPKIEKRFVIDYDDAVAYVCEKYGYDQSKALTEMQIYLDSFTDMDLNDGETILIDFVAHHKDAVEYRDRVAAGADDEDDVYYCGDAGILLMQGLIDEFGLITIGDETLWKF